MITMIRIYTRSSQKLDHSENTTWYRTDWQKEKNMKQVTHANICDRPHLPSSCPYWGTSCSDSTDICCAGVCRSYTACRPYMHRSSLYALCAWRSLYSLHSWEMGKYLQNKTLMTLIHVKQSIVLESRFSINKHDLFRSM